MNKRLAAWMVSGLMGTSMLLGLAGCTPSGPQTDDPDGPTETADEQAPAFTDAEATLSLSGAIDTESARNQISPDLFGLFLEDINYASFALDDNMLINSSFENKQNLSGGRLYGWSVGRGGEMELETEGGVNSGDENFLQEDGTYANEEHLKLTAAAGTILSNSGHMVASPITVIEGTDYVFSAFIKGYTGKITIEVVRGSEVYASGEINVSGADWVKYQTTITATGTMDETGSGTTLRLTFDTAGTVYLDNVKFETTDANEATGIKSYLYEAIEDLSPAFFRFPGGCIIEGRAGETDEYFDWKNSIGAVAAEGGDIVPAFTYTLNVDGETSEVTTYGEQATRSYNTDIWANGNNYYQMEYGLGYYEYFMLCEELGAKAIPIVNCGLSCMAQDNGGHALKGRHNNGIDDFIQDAFDLVAFAKGDPASSDPDEAYWAQVRVNMGHAEPFEMDYIGIGNEQWGTYYERYYEKFLIAFNEKAQENPLYGEVELIVGNCTMFSHCEDPDLNRRGAAQQAAQQFLWSSNCPDEIYSVAQYGVVDQHYYVNFTDLFYNHDLYDSYARPNAEDPNAPENLAYYKVFVGEYAANTNIVRSPGGTGVTQDSTTFGTTEATTSTWLNALSEAAMMTGMERNGDVVVLAAYAPMFGTYQSGARQWQVDMMYYTNTDLVRTPSYFVQQIFMQNTGDHKVASELTYASGTVPTMEFTSTNGSATRAVNTIYYVTSQDAETGDIIVKIVNAGETDVKFNVSLADLVDVELTGIAEVLRVIGEDYTSTNDLNGMNIVGSDRSYKIGFGNEVFGYEAPAMSVTAIRVRTK